MSAVTHARRRREGFAASQIQDLLDWISPDSRADWVRVGAAVKHELGSTGWAVWDDWSRGSERYREKDAAAVWRSLRRHQRPVTGATLVHLARQGGWRPEAPARPERPLPAPRPAPVAETRSTEAYAAQLWAAGDEADAAVMAHPYAIKKHLRSAGGARRGIASGRLIGKHADCILVPCREGGAGKVTGVQAITAEGVKQSFGSFSGGFLLLGNTLNTASEWHVAEGWASAYSAVFHLGVGCCAASFGKSSLRPVAEMLAARFKPRLVIIQAEVD